MTEQHRVDDSILEHLYDVAVDPASYERLIDYWEDIMRPTVEGTEPPEMIVESVSRLADHIQRADKVLGRTFGAPLEERAEAAVGRVFRAATFAVNQGGRLVAVNAPATLMLGVTSGARTGDLPFEPGDADRLVEEVRKILRGKSAETGVLCLRTREAGRLVVVHLRLFLPVSEEAFVLCVTSEISWPAGFGEDLRRAFGLSATEIEILRHLTEGYSVADIATLRTRSSETVRVQVKSMLAKTGARGQLELVRLALSTVEALHGASAASLRDDALQVDAPPRKVHLRRGREMDYLLLGDPGGRPVLFLPIDLGFTRWTAAAEAEARRRKLKIIVAIRPGYGGSSPVPSDAPYFTQLIDDHLALLDHERARRVPVLSQGDDSLLALQLHAAAPERFSALLCCGGVLPLTHAEQYQRIGKWHRFIVTGAKYTPQFLPFIVKAGAALARRYGKRSFLTSIYSVSEADSATFALPEVSEMLIRSSDVMLSETHSAHDAFARELIAKAEADWSGPLEALRRAAERGDLGVHFFNGEQDPLVPLETLREFEADHPWIDFSIYPDAGQLLFYLKWRDVLDKLSPYA